jgi:mannose-6-phosphate isomerase class I
VVTHIDAAAWPDRTGYIRCGFDPQQVAAYPSEDAFRSAYLDAVEAYEKQRRKLDELAGRGAAANSEEVALEQFLRDQMDGFTRMLPLRVGDVIRVPPLLPHALQHGVRVVEFQTPSYERKIISFAQEVLTQEHWDSREAISQMLLAPPPPVPPEAQPGSTGVAVEQIVDFPDFEVVRVRIEAGSHWVFEAESSYRLLIVVSGVLLVSGARYEAERALLLPYSWRGVLAPPEAAAALVFLLARPRS